MEHFQKSMVHLHIKHTRWCGINSLDWTDYWDRSLLTLLCYDAIRNIILRIGHLLNIKSNVHCTYTHTHKYTCISLTTQFKNIIMEEGSNLFLNDFYGVHWKLNKCLLYLFLPFKKYLYLPVRESKVHVSYKMYLLMKVWLSHSTCSDRLDIPFSPSNPTKLVRVKWCRIFKCLFRSVRFPNR